MRASSLAGCALLLAALLACKQNRNPPPDPPAATAAATTTATIAPATSPPPVATAPQRPQPTAAPKPAPPPPAATPPAATPAFAARVVPAGALDGVWLPDFRAERDPSDAGKNYFDAMAHCQGKGLALCTDTQWQKVCAADSSVGRLETWTASWAGDQAIVRGGGGCGSRTTVSGASTAPGRGGFCCERAIGIRTGNMNSAFLQIAHADQLKYEQALNTKDEGRISGMWDRFVKFDNLTISHAEVLRSQKNYWAAHNPLWTLYDVCDVKIGELTVGHDAHPDKGLLHDCVTVVRLGNNLSVLKQQLGRFKHELSQPNKITVIKHHTRTRPSAPL